MAANANFCTLNPLTQNNAGTFSEGNLLFTHTASAWRTTGGTHGMTSGKWYWEAYQYEDLGGNGFPCGIYDIDSGKFLSNMAGNYPGQATSTYGASYVCYTNTGSYATKSHNGSTTNMTIDDGDAGDVWQCAFDADNGKIWFGKNNTWDNSANPALGSNESYSSIPSSTWVPITCSYNDSNSENYVQNFGQDSTFSARISAGGNADGNGFGDFKYAPPTGFLALCSSNLPLSADIDPDQTNDEYVGGKQFHAVEYTGNATTGQAITGLGLQPDLIWAKMTSGSQANFLSDTSRGINKFLFTNAGTAEQSTGGYTTVYSSFDSDGFTLGTSGSGPNDNGATYIAMGWKANGGTTVSNSSGNITSAVQANTKGGFSIVTYTGNGSSAQSIGHGLSSGAPKLIFVKNRDQADDWAVYHHSLGNSAHLILNSIGGQTTSSAYWGNFTPTTTLFKVGSDHKLNASGEKYVAYLWHEVEGFSKFGTYSGSGSTDGTFVYLGFRPKFIFIKKSNEASTTYGYPTFLDIVNDNFNDQYFDGWWLDQSVGASGNYPLEFLSNGFKHRNNNTNLDGSGKTYIYAAWGSVPYKYNNAF